MPQKTKIGRSCAPPRFLGYDLNLGGSPDGFPLRPPLFRKIKVLTFSAVCNTPPWWRGILGGGVLIIIVEIVDGFGSFLMFSFWEIFLFAGNLRLIIFSFIMLILHNIKGEFRCLRAGTRDAVPCPCHHL